MPNVANESTAEFDLISRAQVKWMLRGHTLPDKGLWYRRRAHDMSFAARRAAGCSTIIVRLHNDWRATLDGARILYETICCLRSGAPVLIAGVCFYSSASDLSHVGPITVEPEPDALQSNSATAMAAAAFSGLKSFIAEKLCLAGEILLGIGALGWIYPGKTNAAAEPS